MPSIKIKYKVLDGKGEVFTHSKKNLGKWFYREKLKGVKRYRSKLIKGANSLDDAIGKAQYTALKMAKTKPHHLSLLVKKS